MTKRILPESSIDEYAPAAPTERLQPWPAMPAVTRLDGPGVAIDRYLPQRPLPFVLAFLALPVAAYHLGYAAGYVAGQVQPWVDARGWIALLFIAIGLPILIIFYRERS